MEYEKIGPAPILNFTSQVAKNLKDYKAYFSATGGGGTPTTPIPIVGVSEVNITRAGKNLANILPYDDWSVGTTYAYVNNLFPKTRVNMSLFDNDPSIDISDCYLGFVSSDYNGSSLSPNQYNWIINNGVVQTSKLNSPYNYPNVYLNGLIIYPRTRAGYNKIFSRYKIEIEIGTDATLEYAPYNAYTFTINLGDTYYGGYIDKENGEVTQTYSDLLELNTLSWAYVESGAYFTARINGKKNGNYNFVCSHYKTTTATTVTNMQNLEIKGNRDNDYIYIKDSNYTDKTTFTQSLQGKYITYEMVTPTTFSLPTTLPDISTIVGEQNLFADTGDMEAEYPTKAIYYKAAKVSITDNSNVQIQTASGAVANFNTSLALPLVTLKAYIQAQGGGGTPTTPIPIVGVSEVNVYRRGINLWNEQCEQGAIDSSGNDAADNTRIRPIGYIPVTPNTSLYVVAPTSLDIYYYDANKTFISVEYTRNTRVINIPSNARYIRFRCGGSGYPITPSTYGHDISINYPSTDTSYHAYNPQSDTFTLILGQTVYGGYVDWENGKLVKTNGAANLDELNWQIYTADTTGHSFYVNIPSDCKSIANSSIVFNGKCSCYEITRFDSVPSWTTKDDSMCQVVSPQRWIIRDTDYSDITTFKQSLSGQKVLYELATPTEIDLPTTMPNTIQGVQNWFADTGDIEVSFKKIAETQA
ncbi:MAG: hypothetical protein IJ880_03360 [Bacilli bacterium]|nr:hypothetical protein [Bacilli bacterium]